MGLKITSSFWLVLMLFNTLVKAQNTNESRIDSTRWKYEVNLNISGRLITGTFNQFVFSPQSDVDLYSKRWYFSNILNYHYNSTNDRKIEDNWYEMFTASYFVKGDKLFPTVFYNYENNLMFRINARHLAGGGLSTQKRWENSFVRLDVGGGYEIAIFNGDIFENSSIVEPRREKEFFVMRLVQQHHFWKNRIAFSNMIFYRHSLRESQDFFLRIAPSVSFKITNGLAASARYIFLLENVHLINLSNTNTALVFGLTFKFKN